MNVFELRDQLISDYSDYIRGFIHIADQRVRQCVDDELAAGRLWPRPLIQLNPSFEPGGTVDELVARGLLHEECRRIFRRKSEADHFGQLLHLYRHQTDAIELARAGHHYVLTTGTGSGKSLSYVIPIVDHVLRNGRGRGIQAIVVYPMNALANSQEGELKKFLQLGYGEGHEPVRFARYTGQEDKEAKDRILSNPPDILLTNYVMLELILTRVQEQRLVDRAKGLRFLVLDELHTYRGRQGADVALLVRRTREALQADHMQCVGTSATLATDGDYTQRQSAVARVASLIFGADVRPEFVVGETLRRATPERAPSDVGFVAELRARIASPDSAMPTDYAGFAQDALSSWIESTFGISAEEGSGRLVRARPRGIWSDEGLGLVGAAHDLAELTGSGEDQCARAISRHLLTSYSRAVHPETGFPLFAFRLHQFVSRGDAVYASVEAEDKRHLTLTGQQFVPGNRTKVLLPLVFCRECGQEYYSVHREEPHGDRPARFVPRELSERETTDKSSPGLLYFDSADPWPGAEDPDLLERVPEEWVETTKTKGRRVAPDKARRLLPRPVFVDSEGRERSDGLRAHFVPAPFSFCLHCGVSYTARQKSDFAKLTSLATEGRSTATTVLTLAAIRRLRKDASLEAHARKLLSFTDNRQDASLQAGHFNDFVEIGLLRSGLYRAAAKAGSSGIACSELILRVFEALALDLSLYASDPDVEYRAKTDTQAALRSVLGYRIYRDLERGWRVTSPNLEQCGLLEIRYQSLDELCANDADWVAFHPALAEASADTRARVGRTLLDYMRRELAIKVDYLKDTEQERIRSLSNQRLRAPWAIDENERLETAKVLYPRGRAGEDEYRGDVYLSARGGFGQYLRRRGILTRTLNLQDTQDVIRDLLKALQKAGLVEEVDPGTGPNAVPGYQLQADAMVWAAGDGTRPFHDPIRIPRPPKEGGRSNPFFVEYYKSIAADGAGLEAHEHTAQVKYEVRVQREDDFRRAILPILFCSPTMELGVDISELNVVNLRNVPPTPANYAQRSGRAGRSGQPALVFTYCSTYSSHDQYFFRRPQRMVSGAVAPPRIDLTNEDLVVAHLHAIWLSESGMDLGSSLIELVDAGGEDPKLPLLAGKRADIDRVEPRLRAATRARRVLGDLGDVLARADWWNDQWIEDRLRQIPVSFDQALNRWRELYRAAVRQQVAQNLIVMDRASTSLAKNQAKRLRAEAEAQKALLEASGQRFESDFYSYRYFASEGFLPGYSFPRLPLSAYIPGSRGPKGRDEFVQRPRFLAISEFGPRAILYHEGARYLIDRVFVTRPEEGGQDILTTALKQCTACGYCHQVDDVHDPDVCERCGEKLPMAMRDMFRMQNVITRRKDRINSDEEERMRLGYDVITGLRFPEREGMPSYQTAEIVLNGSPLGRLNYGNATELWRVNLGQVRRSNPNLLGFELDVEHGRWAKNQADPQDNDEDEPPAAVTKRVIPFVQDRRNALVFTPVGEASPLFMASLQAALKSAIQVEFQLEEMELAAEPLPTFDDRRHLLFFESAEGGAGVLRQIVEEPLALSRVARRALELCHFDPNTGEPLSQLGPPKDHCEAACYSCLMSYGNQRDHGQLDRSSIRDFLLTLCQAEVRVSAAALPRAEHLRQLKTQSETGLERDWLDFLEARRLRLPTHAQRPIEPCHTRPDFEYSTHQTAIYVDGPHHEFPERQLRDRDQTDCMMDLGYTVLRFGLKDDWDQIVNAHPSVFGVNL